MQMTESKTDYSAYLKKITNSKEESVMKLVPLFDRVVLKQLVAEESQASFFQVRQRRSRSRLRLSQLARAEWLTARKLPCR